MKRPGSGFSSTLLALPLALCAIALIRALGLGVGVFVALLVANAALGLFGIVGTAMNRRWKPCLIFAAWFCFPMGIGLYLLHLWHTLPDH